MRFSLGHLDASGGEGGASAPFRVVVPGKVLKVLNAIFFS